MLPFDGESMGEVLVKQVTAAAAGAARLQPEHPADASSRSCCAASRSTPDARFPTMQALREALLDPEAYLRGSPPIAPARSVAPGEASVEREAGDGARGEPRAAGAAAAARAGVVGGWRSRR